MCPRAFEPKLEVFKRIERTRKSGKIVTSHKSFKELSPQELIKLREIKAGREGFLKELGLVGNKKDLHLDLRKYEEYKQRLKQLQEKAKHLKVIYEKKKDNLYKDALLGSFAIMFIKKDIIPNLENQALKKRLTKLLSSNNLNSMDSYVYPKWGYNNTRHGSFEENEHIKKKYPQLYKHFTGVGSWGGSIRPGDSYYNIKPEVVKILFKKYPFLSSYKELVKGKKQLELEKKINEHIVKMEEISKYINSPNDAYSIREYKIFLEANSKAHYLNPIIWGSEVDELFHKRYGITLSEVYTSFDKIRIENKESKPLTIIDTILNKSLKQPSLLVFPLNGSLFNYFLTKGIISEIKRLKLNKYDLDAVTISSHGFEYTSGGTTYRPYGNNYSDITGAPDIVSGQIRNIIKKHKNVSRISMVDMISSGFQKGYLDYYFKKGYREAGIEREPVFEGIDEREYQEFGEKENRLKVEGLVSKVVSKNQNEKKVSYQNPLQSKYVIENREKAREMLEIAGRFLLRAELKIRNSR